MVRYSGRHRERFCVSGLRSFKLSAQVRRQTSCIFVSQTKWTLPLRAPAETVEFALRTVKNLSVNQTLSQPTKCIQFKPHKAPEHTKLQAPSYGEVS